MVVTTGFLIVILIGFLALLLPVIANIIQNGKRLNKAELEKYHNKYQGKLNQLRPDDLRKMTKKEVFRLFQILPAVDIQLLNKTFKAENLPQAALYHLMQLITDQFFGPGKWFGKGFKAENNEIKGYNIFILTTGKKKSGRPFEIRYEVSEIDGGPVTKLDYRPMNHGFVAGTLRDELRQVNEKLFLGMGINSWGLGSINPAHFMVYEE